MAGLLMRVAFRMGRAIGYLRERRKPTPAPPKGDRPVVRLHYDGIIYDLTDTLERLADDHRGHAVWRVHGPAHLRMINQGMVEIDQPMPQQTSLDLRMVSDPEHGARFKRPDEY